MTLQYFCVILATPTKVFLFRIMFSVTLHITYDKYAWDLVKLTLICTCIHDIVLVCAGIFYIKMNIVFKNGGTLMLAMEGLLKSLSTKSCEEKYEDRNNDYNFSEVLKACGDSADCAHTIRYADGQEENFSFDK